MSTIKLNRLIPANAGIVEQVSQSSGDNGTLVKRFQTIDGVSDDVLVDSPAETSAGHGGNAQSGSSVTITLNGGANATDDFYNGWWIYLTAGTGNGQVRRIKDYTGASKIATIYSTADAVDDGLDFVSPADATTVYSLFNRTYVGSFYDESVDEWVIGFMAEAGSNLTIQQTTNLRVNNMTIDGVLNTTGLTNEGTTLIDSTDTEALLVRKNADGGDIFTVDTTNTEVNIGPGTANHGTMLSLYGTTLSESLGPHITATTTTDIYPVFQQLNYAHDNITLLFDSYWNSGFKSSDSGSNFNISKTSDTLRFNFDSGIAAGSAVTFETGMSMSNTGTINIPTTTTVGTTVNPSTSTGGALNVNGDLVLGTTTPRIYFPDNIIGVGAPTFTNRSTGTKIVLYPNIGAASVDYAIGIDANVLWTGIPASNRSFKWYAGITEIMSLSGSGNLTTQGQVVIDTTSTEALLVRKDADGGDVFTVDTTNEYVLIQENTGRDASTIDVKDLLYLRSDGTSGTKWPSTLEIQVGTYEANIAARTRVDFKLVNGSQVAADTTVMTMTANGRVGIANTAPTSALDVIGDIKGSGLLTINQEIKVVEEKAGSVIILP